MKFVVQLHTDKLEDLIKPFMYIGMNMYINWLK